MSLLGTWLADLRCVTSHHIDGNHLHDRQTDGQLVERDVATSVGVRAECVSALPVGDDEGQSDRFRSAAERAVEGGVGAVTVGDRLVRDHVVLVGLVDQPERHSGRQSSDHEPQVDSVVALDWRGW